MAHYQAQINSNRKLVKWLADRKYTLIYTRSSIANDLSTLVANDSIILFEFSACEDFAGRKFSAPSRYDVFKCAIGCYCRVINGIPQARCHFTYCPRLRCPTSMQVKVQGSCCKRCPRRPGKLEYISFVSLPTSGVSAKSLQF